MTLRLLKTMLRARRLIVEGYGLIEGQGRRPKDLRIARKENRECERDLIAAFQRL